MADIGAVWTRAARKAGRDAGLQREGLRRLESLPLEDAQMCWAIDTYMKDAVFPSVLEFEDDVQQMLNDGSMPDSLLAVGLTSDSPTAQALADELQTLRAAWFPTDETRTRVREIEGALKGLL